MEDDSNADDQVDKDPTYILHALSIRFFHIRVLQSLQHHQKLALKAMVA